MKNKAYIFLAVIIVILFFTNPNKETHQQAVVDEYNYAMIPKETVIDTTAETFESNAKKLGENFGKMIVEKQLKENTFSDNYGLFSVTKYRGRYAGFGVLQKVYLSDEFTDLLSTLNNN